MIIFQCLNALIYQILYPLIMKLLEPFSDLPRFRKALHMSPIENAGFIHRAFHSESDFNFFADRDMEAVMAIDQENKHMLCWGNWDDVDIPLDALPEDSVFVSACPANIYEVLKNHLTVEGEWPCWHFLAPDGYGPGEWDELGPLVLEDVPFVAEYWELGGEDREKHIRESVELYESACLRVRGKPVSWCGLHFEIKGVGNLGFAHTLEEHRRKGYQKLVTKALVNRIAAKGSNLTCHVIKGNTASEQLCKSLGFRIIGEQVWADLKVK